MIETVKQERALLVMVLGHDEKSLQETLSEELKNLAESAGLKVSGLLLANRRAISPRLYIGKGKAEEILAECQEINPDVVIFNVNLKPGQQRNLEDLLGTKVIDYTQLIVDIFAKRAHTQEGMLQVELAQTAYLLPRLKGKGTMLSQQGGGIGTLGPGEKKLEIDRRRIEERVDRLRKEIEEIRQHRGVLRKKREKENVKICSLVGYTNAGKSTLFNALAQSHEKTADSLFTTLDTVSNTFNLKDNLNAVIADTVGFIHKLPPHLVDAFKATLEELEHADLIIHIIDVSSPDIKRLKQSVDAMLSELGLLEKPILLVFNKIDKAGAEENLWLMGKDYPNAVSISALNGTGLDILKEKIFEIIFQEMKQAEIKLSFQQMELANYVHKTCEIIKKEYSEKEIVFSVRAKESNLAYLKKNGAQVNEI